MHECIKEKCRHWQRASHKGCSMITTLEKECLGTGEFQHRKTNPGVPMDEWEDVQPFTMMDLARIGVDDTDSFKFCGIVAKYSPSAEYYPTIHRLELAKLGIFDKLEEAGFVRRIMQEFKPGDCFETHDGVVMVVKETDLNMIAPEGSIYIVDASGTHWATSRAYMSEASMVELTTSPIPAPIRQQLGV